MSLRHPSPPKFFLLSGFLAVTAYTGFHLGHERGLREGAVRGYLAGTGDGYTHGVFTCPCWKREGSVCSLCGMDIRGSEAFNIIRGE